MEEIRNLYFFEIGLNISNKADRLILVLDVKSYQTLDQVRGE
jgi:hypothetical protein